MIERVPLDIRTSEGKIVLDSSDKIAALIEYLEKWKHLFETAEAIIAPPCLYDQKQRSIKTTTKYGTADYLQQVLNESGGETTALSAIDRMIELGWTTISPRPIAVILTTARKNPSRFLVHNNVIRSIDPATAPPATPS